MKSTRSRLLSGAGAIAAGAAALAYSTYQKDIKAARKRIKTTREVIDTPLGPIEFAESGDGPAVLMIHGAGGGFDQGLDLGRAFVGAHYRVIAPSRFGYLGTPLPADASAAAQADAHVRLLDALHIDRVPVIAVSAGGPSAMQFCLKYPDRCLGLVLIVPMAWSPRRATTKGPSRFFETVLNTVASSDFLFWTASKVAHSTVLKTILGTPVQNYCDATTEQRRSVDQMLQSILPISKRVAGIGNDGAVSSTLKRYQLEDIHVPTLVISAADDLYATYDSGLYTAEQVHDGEFVGFPTGGHLLVGHEAEVQSKVTSFLKERLAAQKNAAMAVSR